MNRRSLLATAAVVLAMLACNMPAGATPTPLPTPTPLFTELPSATPLPTATPVPTATSTPTIPIAWPKDVPVNCRYGPGIEWLNTSGLLVGQVATIQGRNASSSWWYVVTPLDPGTPCWVAASVTLTAGNLAGLPVIPTPEARVTNLELQLDPKNQTLGGCFGPPEPIDIEGSITTNGPTEVKWHLETEEGGSMGSHTLEFDKYTTKGVAGTYMPTTWPGTYWVRLIVTQPNGEEVEKNYKIQC